ncbi:hypothetical protein SCORR_v1c04440 [Spiroplasma corruscae]|uniref:Lipoprotein n=1 Tax=Spiroplasma corruscae TaxID=216934 RepID=A0A222ENZ2_9MOLU|nr:lipoprotein [Spiroplasma corruscae]ASP28218.1 hypothetical protein SCORR_v1c04440 [Spiroplasma corruscae]
MKKLISILATLSLTATLSTSVIACGNSETNDNGSNNVDPTPNETDTYDQVFTLFKKEVTDIINKNISIESKNWFQQEDESLTSKFKFFKQEKIASYFDNYQAGEVKNANLSDIFKKDQANATNYFNDLKFKVGFDKIKSEINALKSKTEYDILLNGVTDIITIENSLADSGESTSKISVLDTTTTETNNETKKGYIISSSANFNFSIHYNSSDNSAISNFDVKSSLDYTLTSYPGLAKFIMDQSSSIKWAYLKNVDTTGYIKGVDESNKLINSFSTIKENVNSMLSNDKTDIIKSLNDSLNASIGKDLAGFFKFENKKVENNNLPLYNIEELKEDNVWDYKINPTVSNYSWNNEQKGWSDSSFKNGEDLMKYIFIKDEKTNDSELNKYLLENLKKWSSEFIQSVETNEDLTSETDGYQNIKTNLNKLSAVKFIPLNNIQLSIGDTFKKDMDEFKLGYGEAIDINNNFSSLVETDNTFKAIRDNVKQGIVKFNEIFDMKFGENTTDNKQTLFTVKKENSFFWDFAKVSKKMSDLNNLFSLNLNNSDVISKRKLLLEGGNQNDYSLVINDKRIYTSPLLYREQLGLESPILTGINYYDVNIKFDYLNINFRTDFMYHQTGGYVPVIKNY